MRNWHGQLGIGHGEKMYSWPEQIVVASESRAHELSWAHCVRHWLGRHQESITCSCSVQGWKDLESKINSKLWNSWGIGSGQGCCHPSCVTRLVAANLCIKCTLCNGRNTKIQNTRRHKYKATFMESETPDGAHELVVVGAHLVAADGFLGLHSHQLLQSQLDFCHQPRQCRCQFTENWQQYPRPIYQLLAMIFLFPLPLGHICLPATQSKCHFFRFASFPNFICAFT